MSTPLFSRVDAPMVAAPGEVAGISWRPATMDDLDEVFALCLATAAADHPSFALTRPELVEEFEHSYFDPDQDSIIGVDDSTGRFVAFGAQVLLPGQETLVRSIIEGAGVHPDYRGRGIGRALMEWHEQRGLQQLASSDKHLPGWIQAWADDEAVATGHLFTRLGYPPARWFLGLTRIVAEPIPDVQPAEGVTIVPFAIEHSAAAHAAKDAAFRDHWGSQPSTDEQWNSMIGLDALSFDHSFLALDPDGYVVGVLLTWLIEEDWARQGYTGGYVGIVGVIREWRRKSIAPALLAANLRSLRAAGLERSDLDVDSDNPTGALGLYTGMGFTEQRRSANYVRVF